MWFGVSIENAGALVRLRHLQEAPAGLRFLSVEPLLGPIGELDLTRIDWVIVGGQSGRGHQTMDLAWAREVFDQCRGAGVAFFMKQDSGPKAGKQGRLPDDLWNIKEWPGSEPMSKAIELAKLFSETFFPGDAVWSEEAKITKKQIYAGVLADLQKWRTATAR